MMIKKVSKKNRSRRNAALLGALMLGLLFGEGGGYIGGHPLLADDPTSNNVNVDVSSGATVSDATFNTGLTGANSGTTVTANGTILLQNNAVGVVGVLDTTGTSTTAVSGVDLTLANGGKIQVGAPVESPNVGNNTDLLQQGILIINGSWTQGVSTVNVANGSVFSVGAGGRVEVGSSTGKGILQISNGGSLFNTGTSVGVQQMNGIEISKYGTLTVGTEDALTEGNVLDGDGEMRNAGKIQIYNKTGADNQAYIGVYTDYSGASLTSTGNLVLNAGTGTIDEEEGKIIINGTLSNENLTLMSDSQFTGTSSVTVNELLTVGDTTSSGGANLYVNGPASRPASATTKLGGLKVIATGTTTPVGGMLETDSTSYIQINGLESKFDGNGTQSEDGIYDIWLGSKLTLNGKLSGSLEKAVSDAAEGEEDNSSKNNPRNFGIRFHSDNADNVATIGTNGVLVGDNLTLGASSFTDGGTATIENSGTLTVYNNLKFVNEDSTGKFIFKNKAVSSKASVVESLTLTDNQYFENGNTSSSASSMTINNLTVDGKGQFSNGYGAATIKNLTLNSLDNSLSTNSIVFKSQQTGTVTVANLNLVDGIMQLESTASGTAGGLKGGTDAVFNIGKAGQESTQTPIVQIYGNDATFADLTLNLDGRGQITQELGYSLTFNNAIVNNNSEILAGGSSALTSDAISFTGTSVYRGANYLNTSDLSFASGTSLYVESDEELSLKSNGNFNLGKDAAYYVGFGTQKTTGTDGTETVEEINGKIKLSGAGVANLAEGSIIAVSDASNLASGTYTGKVVVDTDNDDSIFDQTLKSTAFYNLSVNENSGQDLILDLNVKSDFADFGVNENQRAVGTSIDQFRQSEGISEGLQSALYAVTDLETDAEVADALQQIGNSNQANSMMLAMDSPWQNVFDQIGWAAHRSMSSRSMPGIFRGQNAYTLDDAAEMYADEIVGETESSDLSAGGFANSGSVQNLPSGLQSASALGGYATGAVYRPNWFNMSNHSFWATAKHTTLNANSDGNGTDYGISRTGMVVGADGITMSGNLLGAMFSYTQPYLYSQGNTRITATNFQFGLYGAHQYSNLVEAKGYVGFGLQQYSEKRWVNYSTYRDHLTGTTNGRNLSACLQFSRPYTTDFWTILRPLVQIDTQQVWKDGFDEKGGGLALSYDDASWNRTFVRAGLSSELNTEFFSFTGRAIYGYQLGGDEAPIADATFIGAPTGTPAFTNSGVNLGKSFLDVGAGAMGYLDCERRFIISGNYDCSLSEESTAHTGTLGLMYQF